MKEIRGHDKDVAPYHIEGITLVRCPLIVLGQKYDHYIKAYMFWQQGFFPNTGGWGEQPNALIEALMHIDCEINRMKDNGKQ